MFFIGITVMFLLFLITIFLGVFLSSPKNVPQELIFNKPKVNVDMKIFESDQFKNLKPFIEMQTQYSYTATTKDKKIKTGFISAISISQAKTILEGMGLTVSDIKEIEIGRSNPFIPYYQPIITPAS